ncbi:NACHT and WD repeat domain-containing 2 [Brachionus plicatilis]|uniref:NACHT and WD repeat domain-containing 2 n=1 Tax=Brachionus plicatilis TaxID=10195 RepID=A0A3M7T870_BRAPC|nr:NACHT and WD repeat domain-containing 2 [Brachionus plicatilis]
MSLDLKTTIEILKGKYDNVPDLRKKNVRIFLSSTFTDTNSERDYLIEKIYPKLKDYCRVNYDIDFQAVDMRWGIPSDAYEYHGTTELCLKEILNCKKVSVGPNFVTIIGQKYGLRPLPTKILSDEFEMIVSQIEPEDILSIHFEPEANVVFKLDDIVLACYRLDTNQVPSVHRLLPISKIVPTYLSNEPKVREHSQIFWEKLKNKLSILLRILADRAFNKKLIDKFQRDRYFISITEKEILSGIMQDNDPDSNCLCFFRNIENLEQNLDDQSIGRFTDVIKNNDKKELDLDAKKLLTLLIDEKISSKLNSKNIEKFNVKWSNNKIENLEAYLESFGSAFYRQIIRLVDKAVERTRNEEKWLNEIYFELGLTNKKDFDLNNVDQKEKDLISEFKNFVTEISHHAIEYSEIVGKFFGREHLTVKVI